MKISLCMVLRDEGKTIKRCLASMIGMVDEWIIGIDTQTTDNTKDEVKAFFDSKPDLDYVVYDYEWKDSFSKARNEGMDKATGDYILIMDGHEFFPDKFFNITEKREIDNKGCFAHMKESLAKEPDIEEGHFHLYQQPFVGNTPNNYFLQPRIYKNTKDIRFGRDAHNTIKNTHPEKTVMFPEIIILHDAPEDNRVWRKEQRIRMNTKALQEDIEKNPGDTRAMFYLGNTRLEAEDFEQAIYWYGRYLDTCKAEHSEKYQVLLHKSIAHKLAGDNALSRDCAVLATGIDPNRRDAYMVLGNLYFDIENYEMAVHYYNMALRVNPQSSRMFQNGPTSTWDPHQRIAFAYEKLKQYPKAVAHLKTACSYFENPKWLELIDEWKARKPNLLILDHIGSFTRDIVERLRKSDQFNVVYLPEYDSRMVQWADYIWCEWGDYNALRCSQTVPQKTVIRIHGYEAYLNREMLSRVDWLGVKRVIYVAKHIQTMLKDLIPVERTVVIPNGVDIEKFNFSDVGRIKNSVGYAGYINEKKNPFLLIKAIKANPNMMFNLRVDFQDIFWKETFAYELKDCKNVVYHPRYEKLSDFWQTMENVISTSIIESFSYNIAEAMACGCKPYIYNWKGADDIWPKEFIFNDMPSFDDKFDRVFYRDYIRNNFDSAVRVPELLEAVIR